VSEKAKPEPREIPLGDSAQVLSELNSTADGAKQAAQAAIGAANQAAQRYQDAALMFRKTHKVSDDAECVTDFKRGVLVVKDKPA
jgi:hypothetical protein